MVLNLNVISYLPFSSTLVNLNLNFVTSFNFYAANTTKRVKALIYGLTMKNYIWRTNDQLTIFDEQTEKRKEKEKKKYFTSAEK